MKKFKPKQSAPRMKLLLITSQMRITTRFQLMMAQHQMQLHLLINNTLKPLFFSKSIYDEHCWLLYRPMFGFTSIQCLMISCWFLCGASHFYTLWKKNRKLNHNIPKCHHAILKSLCDFLLIGSWLPENRLDFWSWWIAL